MNVLVVDDDGTFGRMAARQLAGMGHQARHVPSVDAALANHAACDLLLFDLHLPGEDWRNLVRAALNWPKVPRMLATSIDAEPEETFELGKLGVENFLHKMPEGGTFEETLRAALEGSEDGALERLGNLLAHRVGSESVRDVQGDVRTVMVQKALERANGNRRQAARELGVSRQAVQQAVSVTKRRRDKGGK